MWSPAKFIINNNAKVPVLMNLFNMTVFKTKIKRATDRQRDRETDREKMKGAKGENVAMKGAKEKEKDYGDREEARRSG